MITIAGGKYTTYRSMAKDTVDAACRVLGVRLRCVTDTAPFPGALPAGFEEYLKHAVRDMSAQYKMHVGTVRHLILLYGARAEKVLELAGDDLSLKKRISPQSDDIYAQVSYSVREEGAKTVSDILLRRMQLGITASRGLRHAGAIARIAGRELGWDADEAKHQTEEFKIHIRKDRTY